MQKPVLKKGGRLVLLQLNIPISPSEQQGNNFITFPLFVALPSEHSLLELQLCCALRE